MITGWKFKSRYKSPQDNVVDDFLVPTLREAISYDRAVGYFSSTSLIALTRGISKMIENGGHMRVICSPELSSEDIEAIQLGYKNKREVFESAVSAIEVKAENYFDEERLNMLAYMIENGQLDIKIAFVLNDDDLSIFHDKIGIISDGVDFVAFGGSMNETLQALTKNHEYIDVFPSNELFIKANEKRLDFEQYWNNLDSTIDVIDFPDDLKKKITQYRKGEVKWNVDKEQFVVEKKKGPCIPKYIVLRDYQNKAIDNWKANNYRGIYSMCTGAGKTITALASAISLLETSERLGIVIICPYQHLVDQWCEDLEEFSFDYIVGYSSSPQKNWKEKLSDAVFAYSNGIKKYFCLITTNDTFATKYVRDKLGEVDGHMLIVADEAHNLGTERLLCQLDERFDYRLALSATINRHNDAYGTMRLFEYFEKECIKYTLKQAINDNQLTPYYYHPIVVYLDDNELEEYEKLTKTIAKYTRKDKHGNLTYDKKAEIYLIERARIVAGCNEKIQKLADVITDNGLINKNHMLVYCGATTAVDYDFKEKHPEIGETRQLEMVENKLGNGLNMDVKKFTSEEDAETRRLRAKEFAEGKSLQVLVAIRCLDEGVNIPCIDTAFILASSTNPKEYIQRRGRVLRKAEGKEYATIYDFITLPKPLDEMDVFSDLGKDLGLVKRELLRAYDFAIDSKNPIETEELINEIENSYQFVLPRGGIDSED